jgi:hypothetical protein
MSKPHVEHIHIAGAAGAPMRRLSEATAIKGLGLAGDRYWARAGFWQDNRVSRDLTLIEGESIDRIANELGAPLGAGKGGYVFALDPARGGLLWKTAVRNPQRSRPGR